MGKRLFAIGDIHGDLDALKNLINFLDLQEDDHLIFLGDYVDRGPDSYGVIEYLLELDQHYKCHFILGNHEEIMLKTVEGDQRYARLWVEIGGNKTLLSYDSESSHSFARSIPSTHLSFLREKCLPFYIQDSYIFTHASWDITRPAHKQDRNTLRYCFLKDSFLSFNSKTSIICGHSSMATGRPMKRGNITCIDTIYTGWLTAYDVTNECFYQAHNDKKTRILQKADPWNLKASRGLQQS